MIDIRYADSLELPAGSDLILGVTLNNNPTLADIYNSTPMWSFPHIMTEKAVMPTTALVDMMLFRQVAGPGVYGFFNNMVYGEFAVYRTTRSGIVRPFGAGAEREMIVRGWAPYWRLALERSSGPHTLMVGTFGLSARVYPDHEDLSTPTDRFRDIGFDGQYHFDAGSHIVSAHAIWIRERQKWDASFPMGATSNTTDKLTTARADIHYFFQRRYGFGLQRFWSRGDQDPLRYNTGMPGTGSVAGKPDSRGWQLELKYLPVEWVKLGVRYTAYERFNGAKTDYDGFGRKAKDNNTTYVYAWILL